MIIPFIIWGAIFLGIILFIWLLLRFFNFKSTGFVLALSNLTIVFIIAILVYKNLRDAQIEFFWFVLMVLDFPISLLYGVIKPLLLNILFDSDISIKVLTPFIFFALFGSLQYYLIGKALENAFRRRRKNQ